MNGPGSAPRPAMENTMKGMALLSKKPIAQVQQFLTSKTDDYENWKRRILGIQPERKQWLVLYHSYGMVE